MKKIALIIALAVITTQASIATGQTLDYLYDTFDDSVIDTNLWELSGPVSEQGGKIFLGTEAATRAKKENLIGMSFSVIGHQNISVGEHVEIHLATQTPAGDIIVVGEYIIISPSDVPGDPPFITNKVFCQWHEGGIMDMEHLHHIDLQPAQWGITYVFGLEYTSEGSVLVKVNENVVYSFSVPGADIAYSQGGAKYWFRAIPIEVGNVSAEIDWAKAKELLMPVILVHGWRGSGNTWETLKSKLDNAGIPHYEFNYSPATGDPRMYANWLKLRVEMLRNTTGYTGKFDIVCHSMGAMVSRLYMERMGGGKNIRQWIGLAPVNNGAAIASWPLAHLLCPEEAVDQMEIKSPTLSWLNYELFQFDEQIWGNLQHLSPGVVYRNLMGINEQAEPGFNRLTTGKTYVCKKDDKGRLYYYWTLLGDGVVATAQSILTGSKVGNEVFEGRTHSHNDNSSFTAIYEDTVVLDKVVEYLKNPALELVNNYPLTDPSDDHSAVGKGNRGNVNQGQYEELSFLVDSTIREATISLIWPGSDLDLTLVSPSSKVLEPNAAAEYYKSDMSIWYTIDSPETGEWTAIVEAVDVPEEGETFEFTTFYSSPITLDVKTAENKTFYHQDDMINIIAKCTDGNDVITGGVFTATLLTPGLVTDEFSLYDDGSHGDANANDGYYTNNYSLVEKGAYQITVTAQGTYNGTAFERTMPMTIWVTSRADLNYDNQVDCNDLSIFVSHWIEQDCNDPNWCDKSDFDHSGTVNFIDFAIFAEKWLWEKNPADLDIDGDVDLDDYAALANQWMAENCGESNDWCEGADLNWSGKVDCKDLDIFTYHWLEGTTP